MIISTSTSAIVVTSLHLLGKMTAWISDTCLRMTEMELKLSFEIDSPMPRFEYSSKSINFGITPIFLKGQTS